MSGIEVAGLVLGAIPLVISALEHYAEGVATMKRYFRYRRELDILRRQLDTEYHIFLNTCELVLNGIDADTERGLQKRLAKAYSGYIDTITDMSDALEEFKKRLKLGTDGKVRFTDISLFKQEYRRLQFSLSKSDYQDLLTRIKSDNSTLERLTQQSRELEHTRTRCQFAFPALKGIRDFAKSSYSLLKASLQCLCQVPHIANLELESRLDKYAVNTDTTPGTANPDLDLKVVFSHAQAPSVGLNPWQWIEAAIRLLHENPVQVQAPLPKASKAKKSVKFAPQTPYPTHSVGPTVVVNSATPLPQGLMQIQDLCEKIAKLQQIQNDICLGFLLDGITKQKHAIYLLQLQTTSQQPWSILSLEAVLSQRRFTRAQRLRLGLVLASSVLQLNATPWLDEEWGRSDIKFIERNNDPCYERPFISRHFINSQTSAQQQTSAHPQATAGAHRHVGNNTLFSLGVLLIELCYGLPLEEIPQSLGLSINPRQATSNKPASAWDIADRLIDFVYDEGGDRYGDAVRRCIRCDFDCRSRSLDDDKFVEAVYSKVVSLLQDNFQEAHGRI